MRFKSLALLTTLAALFAFNQPLSASIWVKRSVEEIAGDADVIVIARPLFDQVQISKAEYRYSTHNKPGNPESYPFIVSKVLFGQFVKPEQLILIENDGNNHMAQLFFGDRFQAKHSTETPDKSTKPIVKETLLFLHARLHRREIEADFRLVYDGIRILTQGGQTFVPGDWGNFFELQQPQNELLEVEEFRDTVRHLSHTSPTIQWKRRLLRMWNHGSEPFKLASHALETMHSPQQSIFGIPVLSQNIGELSNPQEDLPPVEPQAEQPQHE